MQNFLVNGSLSKKFIQTNKKELQKFIKNETRSGSEFFRGYEQITGPNRQDTHAETQQELNYGSQLQKA